MKTRSVYIFALLTLVLFASCKKESQDSLSVSPGSIEFPKEGSFYSISINTSAASWSIDNPASDWLKLSYSQGTGKTAMVTLSVNTMTTVARRDTLTITAGNAKPAYVVVSQLTTDLLYTLSGSDSLLNISRSGGTSYFSITTTAPQWEIVNNTDWLEFNKTTGAEGKTIVQLTAAQNSGKDPRSAIFTIQAQYAPSVQVRVTQKGEYYPSYNTSPIAPDASGMGSTAAQLAAKIKLGWNLGNSMEAIGGETAWGNPRASKPLIDLVKESGFNAVRIPCSWNQNMANSSTAELKSEWLNRVKDVVQYCVDNDMYVILNIHWDGGWLENNCTEAKQEANNAKQKAFWEQIATHLRDFDEHVLFASANEPNVDDATQMAVLNTYHQTFIDAVRSTGGRNAYRNLVIQGPSTDIAKTNQLMNTLPTDNVPLRMMVEVHYYTPWNFCGMTEDASWGKMFYYWGNGYHSTTDPTRNATWGEETDVDNNFASMKAKFVDRGIPVVLGEYAVTRRSDLTGDALINHLASRAYYTNYVTQKAKANGILPFYWDNGGLGVHGCGIFNRNARTVYDTQVLEALVQGAGK